MRTFLSLSIMNLLFMAIIAAILLICYNPALLSAFDPDPSALQPFKTMLISIVLEAFPFILLGVLISSFMHEYISENWIQRLIPKNPVLGILFACLLGILFPVCECGLIPVIRKLIGKGMPLYIGAVFIVVGPIVNPIVYFATYTAFRSRPDMLYARMGLALLVGITIGFFIYFFIKHNQLKSVPLTRHHHGHHDHHHDHHGHHHHHDHHHDGDRRHRPGAGARFVSMMEHAGAEFFDMGKYLMIGAILTAAVQTFVPRDSLVGMAQYDSASHVFMMGFAYILSLCSTSDAFVASSFVNTFPSGALLAFLVFGPMLDLKSTLMLLSVFKPGFVIRLSVLIFCLVLAGSLIIGRYWLH